MRVPENGKTSPEDSSGSAAATAAAVAAAAAGGGPVGGEGVDAGAVVWEFSGSGAEAAGVVVVGGVVAGVSDFAGFDGFAGFADFFDAGSGTFSSESGLTDASLQMFRNSSTGSS
mmetsp:Transcript_61751/g.135053  ORF Transcript_61751/g.135053 Transcript_61751/m.135053 type:complete len:115 (+) Transcript_61751:389-733(+)